MTAWAQLLHFYQPPTQTHDVLVKVADECYRPLLKVLLEYPAARLAININGVLTELLHEHGMDDVLADLRTLGERGQAEFVGSGKYHPILPLIPRGERIRAIAEHAQTNRALLGAPEWPRGFFPPEMCYDADILHDLAASGVEWFILSGVACPSDWPNSVVDRVRAGDRTISVLFRDDVRSNRISFRETDPDRFVADLVGVEGDKRAYVVTAMDAETYGHHLTGWERDFLAAVYERLSEGDDGIEMLQPGELVDAFPAGPVIEPHASSWSTTPEDIEAGNPFPLWRAPGNAVHELQWEFTEHCLAVLEAAEDHAEAGSEAEVLANRARALLQPALHSCQYWWASRRPMWDVTMIHRGLALQEEVLLLAARSATMGDAPQPVRETARWRTAAARDARSSIESHLIADARP